MDAKYTLVRHSAFAFGGDPTFEYAVELQTVYKKADVKRIEKANGFVFDSYKVASDAEESENYPPAVDGMIPHVEGRFSKLKVDSSEIYVPPARTNNVTDEA